MIALRFDVAERKATAEIYGQRRSVLMRRLEADDLVVEAVKTRLAFADQLRLEGAGAITRNPVLALTPLRLLPLPRPAGSPFS